MIARHVRGSTGGSYCTGSSTVGRRNAKGIGVARGVCHLIQIQRLNFELVARHVRGSTGGSHGACRRTTAGGYFESFPGRIRQFVMVQGSSFHLICTRVNRCTCGSGCTTHGTTGRIDAKGIGVARGVCHLIQIQRLNFELVARHVRGSTGGSHGACRRTTAGGYFESFPGRIRQFVMVQGSSFHLICTRVNRCTCGSGCTTHGTTGRIDAKRMAIGRTVCH